MNYLHQYEIHEDRASILWTYFHRICMRVISNKDFIGTCEGGPLDIGDPHDISSTTHIGYLEDSKYEIDLLWCLIDTVTVGTIVRLVADIKATGVNDAETYSIIVEKSGDVCFGKAYSEQGSFIPNGNIDDIILHLITKEIAENPSKHNRE